MMQDIKRICETPSEEDKAWFPYLANTDWLSSLDTAMRHYKDESFIAQYLSPKLIRDLKLFHIVDDDRSPDLYVNAIHNETGYKKIREALSRQYNLGCLEPDIQIYSVDVQGDRSMTLRYTQQNRIPLGGTTAEVLKHLHSLWKFPIALQAIDPENKITEQYHCPPLETGQEKRP